MSNYPFSDASEAFVEHLLFVGDNFIRLSLVRNAEQSRLHLGFSLEMWLGEYGLDVVAEAQIVNEVRMTDRLVVVFEAAEFGVKKTEVAEVERAPELRLAHAPSASFVIVSCPLVNAHSHAKHLIHTSAIVVYSLVLESLLCGLSV